MTDSATPTESSPASSAVDEGEIAADYLEALLDLVDLDGDIEIAVEGSRTTLIIGEAGDDFGGLSKPEVVAALQELTRLAVQQETGEFSRVVLDIAGSRDARAVELQNMVDEASVAVKSGAASVPLAPMSSYERKLVHDMVREAGMQSSSEGEGPGRRIVILPN